MLPYTIIQIKDQILAQKAQYSELDGLDSTSKVSIFNLWAYCVASVIWIQYQYFDIYTIETDAKIKAQKVYSLLWFRDSALAYRHGHPLVKDGYNLIYSDENYTDQQIQEAQIVKRASVEEKEITGRTILFIKCAKEVGDDLAKLDDSEKAGVVDYFKRIKPAGTKLEVFSDNADDLKLTIDFFYDPLVLTSNGERIDGSTNTPIQDATRDYLKNIRFNGEFSGAELEDLLQEVDGCANGEAYIKNAQYNFQNPVNWLNIPDFVTANGGYMVIDDADFTINFEAKTVKS